MPYSITTKDGITIQNIPDDLPADSQVLKDRVAAIRGAKAPTPIKPKADDPGFAQSMLIGAGKTFDSVMDGMTQLYLGARGEKSALGGLKANVAEKEAYYKPLKEDRPWATGIGEALPAMAIPAGGSATLLGNAGRMALAGALPGALEYGSAEDRLGRAAVGGGTAAALPLLGAAGKTGWSVVEPLFERGRKAIAGRTLNRVAGDSAADAVAKLAAAKPLVPGSMPTAAEVAESGGIAALQRSASAADPEAYAQRAAEQASARLNALRGVAGTEADLAAAKAVRKNIADPLYAASDMGVAPIDSMFKGLQMRPQFKTAVARAQELAKNDGLADIFFRGAKDEPVALIGQGAHYIKKALDEAAEHGSSSYTGTQGAIAASKTNEAFQQWLEKSIPEYSTARQAFEAASKPVNQMKIGQELLNKLETPLGDLGAIGSETAAQYARALRGGDQLAAKVTGFPGAKLDSIMAPSQMETLKAVGQDLARKTNAQNLGRGVGSDTFQKLSMNNIAQQSGMPSAVGGLLSLPGVSRATNWIYRDTDQKLQGLLADALLHPQTAAKLMTDAEKKLLQNSPVARRLLEQAGVRGVGLLGMTAAQE